MITATLPRPLALDQPVGNPWLFGHEEAERRLLDSYRSGRLPHAWIIAGPAGIGKATLAFRFARFVLAHPDPAEPEVQGASSLAIPSGSTAARQIAARAHPNLVVLERPRDEEGKLKGAAIPVDSVRRVGRFLATTPAGGGWRIVVLDAADDLMRGAANALLKMLEEPPAHCLFLLVAHLPGRVLPTIRSRCRVLSLKPLGDALIGEILDAAGIAEGADRDLAVRLAQGSLGRAQEIASEDGRETARAMVDILDGLPHFDQVQARVLSERLGLRGGEGRYRLAAALLLDWIAEQSRRAAQSGRTPAQLACWAEVWEKVSRALAESEIYNLDRTQTLLTVFGSVSAATVEDAAHA